MPVSFKKEISKVNTSLAVDIAHWLRKHGKIVHPPLSKQSQRQLKECFELMDADGSGAIDADELYSAFKLLGLQLKRSEVVALLEEVDKDGSGEVDYSEFLQIMTTTLSRMADASDNKERSHVDATMPFSLMATAYRRKRLIEGLVSRDLTLHSQLARRSGELMEGENEKMNSATSISAASTKTSYASLFGPDAFHEAHLIPRRIREAMGQPKRSMSLQTSLQSKAVGMGTGLGMDMGDPQRSKLQPLMRSQMHPSLKIASMRDPHWRRNGTASSLSSSVPYHRRLEPSGLTALQGVLRCRSASPHTSTQSTLQPSQLPKHPPYALPTEKNKKGRERMTKIEAALEDRVQKMDTHLFIPKLDTRLNSINKDSYFHKSVQLLVS